MNNNSKDIIDELYKTIQSRKEQETPNSWTAKLFEMGTQTICDKVIEEANETIVEALINNKEKLIYESADLLYHLMVLWADKDITPDNIMDELQRRQGTSGITEKNNRK